MIWERLSDMEMKSSVLMTAADRGGLPPGNRLTVKGEEAVAVGTDASATAGWAITMGTKSSAEKETSMAFGYDSHAKVSGGVALGSWSVADTAAGVSGYDPSTRAASTDTSAARKSTLGAVSVGGQDGRLHPPDYKRSGRRSRY